MLTTENAYPKTYFVTSAFSWSDMMEYTTHAKSHMCCSRYVVRAMRVSEHYRHCVSSKYLVLCSELSFYLSVRAWKIMLVVFIVHSFVVPPVMAIKVKELLSLRYARRWECPSAHFWFFVVVRINYYINELQYFHFTTVSQTGKFL